MSINTYINNNRKRLLISLIVLLISWEILTIIPLTSDNTGRYFSDTFDRSVYFERGKWFVDNTNPISEYPQIPTFLFGINHIVSMRLDSVEQLSVYIAFFSLEMILVLFLLFKVLLDLLPSNKSNYAFLLLLPPTIYFTFNRFDILPTFLCIIAYSASQKKQWIFASFILAVGTFTKWYPVLLFPGFLMYATNIESKFQWKMILSFIITSLVILFFSYFHWGTESLLAPYLFHLSRNMEYIALPVLVDNLVQSLININFSFLFIFFFILQVSAPMLLLFIKLDSLDALKHYCIFSIGIFVLFSRIWSPQWFLWLIPFLIISAKNMKNIYIIIFYNLFSYLNFPIIFDLYGGHSYQLQISGVITYIILFIVIAQSAKGFMYSKTLSSLNPKF